MLLQETEVLERLKQDPDLNVIKYHGCLVLPAYRQKCNPWMCFSNFASVPSLTP
jgi:uncharacterized protein YuzB (UPF0349 family)